MPEIKIGIQLASLHMPLKKALHTAARLGATGVEIDARSGIRPQDLTATGRRQLLKLLDDLNLRVASVSFRTNRGYDVLEDLDRRMHATKEAMKFAYSLGANVLVNQIGQVPEALDDPASHQLRACMCDLARFGQHVGTVLAAETGSEPGERLAGFLSSLPESALGIAFNPGNLILNGFSVEQALPACCPLTLLVHAKDGVRDAARRRGVEVPLGRGSAEFPQILGSLEERRYNGWFVIEREECADPVTEIGYGVQFLRNL